MEQVLGQEFDRIERGAGDLRWIPPGLALSKLNWIFRNARSLGRSVPVELQALLGALHSGCGGRSEMKRPECLPSTNGELWRQIVEELWWSSCVITELDGFGYVKKWPRSLYRKVSALPLRYTLFHSFYMNFGWAMVLGLRNFGITDWFVVMSPIFALVW